jgi:hypothetical protein
MIAVIGRSSPLYFIQRLLTKANKTSSICIAIDRQGRGGWLTSRGHYLLAVLSKSGPQVHHMTDPKGSHRNKGSPYKKNVKTGA